MRRGEAGGQGDPRPPRPETATRGEALRLEEYVEELFAREDPLLAELRAETRRRGFPLIHVPPATGRVLQLIAAAVGARRILEVGTLTGYSAIWLARGMDPGGSLLTLEARPEHAAVARAYLERAGLDERVQVREGRAEEILPELGPDGGWDLVFVDADKEGLEGYAREAARLLRPGGVLLCDNTLWKGRVVEDGEEAEEEGTDTATRAVRGFNRAMARSDEYAATILPVGDGLLMAVRTRPGGRGR